MLSHALRARPRAPLAPFLSSRSTLACPLSCGALSASALAVLALHAPQVLAQASAAAAAPAAHATVLITGNPLGATQLAQPAEVLTGEALARRRAGTLGETLDGLPGVGSSGFGPQAGRPVIRGLDGDRIRLLDNGGASADASNLSFDHAVAVDPLVVDRVEVLRGPAALLYGGNATGGVVNTLDNRIPRAPLGAAGGRSEWRLGGAAREQAGALVLEGGAGPAGGLNWHVDAAGRHSQDLRVPQFTPPTEPGEPAAATRRVRNSAGRSEAGALGASWADAQGYLGLAVDGLRQRYGVVVEPDVSIRLQRERLALAGERRGLAGPFSAVEAQASRTRYQHQELEGSGAVGTTFRSLGQEARVMARQAPLALAGGQLHGTLGLQIERLDFSALGEEAFVPGTHTASDALFLLQEWRSPGLTLSAGARRERVRVRSDGDAADAAEPRFGAAAERRFQPGSWMLGLQLPLAAVAPGWSLRGTLGHTERAPAYYELYANGVHVATGAYERGDTTLALERSQHAEAGLQWQQGTQQLQVQVFRTRFANYLALDASGADVTLDDGGSVPEYLFRGVPATLHGLEIEARGRQVLAGWTLDGQATLDWVRGRHDGTREALPRLPPLRLHLGLEAARGALSVGLALQHQAAQRRVPATDTATPAATRVDLSLGWRQRWGNADALWTLKLANLGNALVWNASTVRPARELSPAGGRALSAGLRVGF